MKKFGGGKLWQIRSQKTFVKPSYHIGQRFGKNIKIKSDEIKLGENVKMCLDKDSQSSDILCTSFTSVNLSKQILGI